MTSMMLVLAQAEPVPGIGDLSQSPRVISGGITMHFSIIFLSISLAFITKKGQNSNLAKGSKKASCLGLI